MTRRVINNAHDSISKLNKCGQDIVSIASAELNRLLNTVLNGKELDSNEIRKLETLTRIVNSQQSHALNIEKLRLEIDRNKDMSEEIKVTPEMIQQLKALNNGK